MIDIGSATVGMTVAGMLRRKMKITITTRASARISEKRTSSTDWRMVVDRSYITLMLTLHLNLGHARNRRNALREKGLRVLVDGGKRQGVGGECQEENR